MSTLKSIRDWYWYHAIPAHIWAPIWLRIPEKHRWTIVGWLNKSDRYCWADLVSDALATPEKDPCEVQRPTLARTSERCATVCKWSQCDHTACSCYCGKFRFSATQEVKQ